MITLITWLSGDFVASIINLINSLEVYIKWKQQHPLCPMIREVSFKIWFLTDKITDVSFFASSWAFSMCLFPKVVISDSEGLSWK